MKWAWDWVWDAVFCSSLCCSLRHCSWQLYTAQTRTNAVWCMLSPSCLLQRQCFQLRTVLPYRGRCRFCLSLKWGHSLTLQSHLPTHGQQLWARSPYCWNDLLTHLRVCPWVGFFYKGWLYKDSVFAAYLLLNIVSLETWARGPVGRHFVNGAGLGLGFVRWVAVCWVTAVPTPITAGVSCPKGDRA